MMGKETDTQGGLETGLEGGGENFGKAKPAEQARGTHVAWARTSDKVKWEHVRLIEKNRKSFADEGLTPKLFLGKRRMQAKEKRLTTACGGSRAAGREELESGRSVYLSDISEKAMFRKWGRGRKKNCAYTTCFLGGFLDQRSVDLSLASIGGAGL